MFIELLTLSIALVTEVVVKLVLKMKHLSMLKCRKRCFEGIITSAFYGIILIVGIWSLVYISKNETNSERPSHTVSVDNDLIQRERETDSKFRFLRSLWTIIYCQV